MAHLENVRQGVNDYLFNIDKMLLQFIDAKDSQQLIATHIYLLIGSLWPLYYSEVHGWTSNFLRVSGLIAICIGDSFVSSKGGNCRFEVRANRRFQQQNSGGFFGLRLFQLVDDFGVELFRQNELPRGDSPHSSQWFVRVVLQKY